MKIMKQDVKIQKLVIEVMKHVRAADLHTGAVV